MGRVLDSSITPHKHVHTYTITNIQFPLPTCQGSQTLHSHAHVHVHTQKLAYQHMWAWLESCGWLTKGTVFIFCLWHGSSNDFVIVLSAQHSLPINIQNSSAAGYPHLWNLQRHTHSHRQKDLVATVVNRSSKLSSFAQAFAVWSYLLLHLEKCWWGWDGSGTRQLCAISAIPVD